MTFNFSSSHPPPRAAALPLVLVALVGCGDDGPATASPATVQAAVSTYAEIVHASYADSRDTAEALDAAIATLVGTDGATEPNLEAARDAWRAAREPYLQTEVYRFYEGPIDDPATGPEGYLNAWPMNEAHVDYVLDATSAVDEVGIIHDAATYPTIDATTLLGLNESPGETDIAVGYHPIEFLLWGQDLVANPGSLPTPNEGGAGERPATDFVDGMASNADRRRTYLTVLGDVLVGHLEALVDAWAPASAGNYREGFEADPDGSLEKILIGMLTLSGVELSGERLQVALDNADQEDEHSCFSDNTHRDMVGDALGIRNVYRGEYDAIYGGTDVDGTGVYDVLHEVDPELADQLAAQIAESVALAEALEPPFDLEISASNTEGRARAEALITSLRDQAELIEDAIVRLGYSIPQP